MTWTPHEPDDADAPAEGPDGAPAPAPEAAPVPDAAPERPAGPFVVGAPATRRPWLVPGLVAAGVVLVVTVVAVWLLGSRDDDGAAGARQAAEDLVAAAGAGDCARVQELTTEDYFANSWGDCQTLVDTAALASAATWEFGEVTVSGGTARVDVSTSLELEGETLTQEAVFVLERHDGAWVVVADES